MPISILSLRCPRSIVTNYVYGTDSHLDSLRRGFCRRFLRHHSVGSGRHADRRFRGGYSVRGDRTVAGSWSGKRWPLDSGQDVGKRSAGDPPLAVGAKTGEYQEAEGRIGTAGHPWSGAGKVGDASGGASEHGGLRGRFVAWVPAALGVAALLISIYAVQGQEPLERIILREKVVEKPVVTERVVVERETVTVTVPVYVDGGMPASGKPASGTPASGTPAESATTSSSTTTTVSAKRKATTPGTATTSSSSTTSTGDEKPSSTTTTPTTVPPTSSSTSSTTSR